MAVYVQTIQVSGEKCCGKISVFLYVAFCWLRKLKFRALCANTCLPTYVFQKTTDFSMFGSSLRHILLLRCSSKFIWWSYIKEKGETQARAPWGCSFGGMNQSISRKWHVGPQGPEETQAGERCNNAPVSVTSARRRFRVEVAIQKECFKQCEEQRSPRVTLQNMGMEGKKVEAAGEGQAAYGGSCHPQKSWSWQIRRLIRTPSP